MGSQPASAVQSGGDAAHLLDDAAISQYEFENGVMIASRHRFAKVRRTHQHKPQGSRRRCMPPHRNSPAPSVLAAAPALPSFACASGRCTERASTPELACTVCTALYCDALQRVERETLARQCPTLLTLLKSFPLSMSLQEPTFKDLVVVYRWGVGFRVSGGWD